MDISIYASWPSPGMYSIESTGAGMSVVLGRERHNHAFSQRTQAPVPTYQPARSTSTSHIANVSHSVCKSKDAIVHVLSPQAFSIIE